MNFLKEKIKKYQEKKLLEAKDKLKFYTQNKTKLENQLKSLGQEDSSEIQKKIETNQEFIVIWNKNIESINKQLEKLGARRV